MSNPNQSSGMYKCKTPGCTKEVVHKKGENFIVCEACSKNNWYLASIDLSKTQVYLEWIKTMLYLDTISQNAKKRTVKRGGVYNCKLGIGVGSEECKERPCVILQADSGNATSSNTIVAPITHAISTLPIVVPIENKFDSNGNVILDGNVLLGNVVTVSKARLGNYICDLVPNEMPKVDEALSISIDVKRHYDKLIAIHEDKLEYIEKLKSKNKEYKEQVDLLESIKKLLNINNSNDIIDEIKNVLEKNVDKLN